VAIADLEGALGEIGFLDGDQGERVMASVASILVRSGLDERESRIVRGIARQIRWAARRGATQKL
jgi:tRNA C32,U32 (ribose-2'-O)-methylase TrmJ